MHCMSLFDTQMSIISALKSRKRFQGFFALDVFGAKFLALALVILLANLGVLPLPSNCYCIAGERQDDSIEVATRSIDGEIAFVIKNASNVNAVKVKVWLGDANVNIDPAMLGATSIVGDEVVFTPRFPISAGTKYNVQVSTNSALKPDNFLIEIPKKKTTSTQIEQIYPSSDVLPENTLKFYVHFSAPMRKGNVYRYLQIREVDGKPVELPFLEIEQEFWSRDSKRLTLLLDPGRIKRGLKPREEMGPIFVQGKTYELVVDGDWPDGNSQPLGKDFIKRFRVAAEDHQRPDPTRWKTKIPSKDTKQPFIISFSESLDHSMLQTAITILDSQSKPIAGRIEISKNESQWSITPESTWKTGSYTIEINSQLEDNAGNSIEKQFDVDVFDKTQSTNTHSTKLTFEIGKTKS